jgi:hypothetical protein
MLAELGVILQLQSPIVWVIFFLHPSEMNAILE